MKQTNKKTSQIDLSRLHVRGCSAILIGWLYGKGDCDLQEKEKLGSIYNSTQEKKAPISTLGNNAQYNIRRRYFKKKS